jgi:Domain of unknown function (DUF1883)
MNYLHYEFDLLPDDAVEVTLDGQANVRLLDPANFSRYQRGEKHTFYGGLAKESPVEISPPHAGHWHVVVDLGGYAGTIRAGARVLKGAS